MGDELEKYRDISKRVVMPRYRCPCNHHVCSKFDSHGNTDSDKQDGKSTPEKEYAVDNYSMGGDDGNGIFSTLKHVEEVEEEDVSVKLESEGYVTASKAGKTPTHLEYKRTCSPGISFKDITDVMKNIKSSTTTIPHVDKKCLQFCYSVIQEVTKRGGEKVWENATLAVYGSDITVILQAGEHDTNHFEIAVDHEDRPIQNCQKRGLRLQFWDSVPMVVSASKTLMPIIGKLIPQKLVADQLMKLFSK